MLFVGKPAPSGGKLIPGNELWYGVALDEEMGLNNGCADGIKYFHCREKHGLFVQSMKFHMAEMSVNNIVLKALLGGEMVSAKEVGKLMVPLLVVFIVM